MPRQERSRQTCWIWFCLGFLVLQILTETPLVHRLPGAVPKVLSVLFSSLFVLCWLASAWLCGSRKNLRFGLFLLVYWFLPGAIIAIIYPKYVTGAFCGLLFFACSALTTGPSVGFVDLLNDLLFGGRSVMAYKDIAVLVLLLYASGSLFTDLRQRFYRF